MAPLAIMLATGAGLFFYGRSIPVHTDHEAFMALRADACDAKGNVIHGWHEQMAALETMRYPFMQGGISLALAVVTIFFLIFAFWDASSARLVTPKRKWLYFALGIGVLGLSWLSQMHSLTLDMQRGVFPWCADTIIIPMMGLTSIYSLLALICVAAGAGMAFLFRPLPVQLWQWRNDLPGMSWAITTPFALLALLVGYLGIDGALRSSFIGTPAALLALYLIEATRSALLAPDQYAATDF